jgi:hypothetical protein
MPSEWWESDFTRYRLVCDAGAEVMDWLDDHSATPCRSLPTPDFPALSW